MKEAKCKRPTLYYFTYLKYLENKNLRDRKQISDYLELGGGGGTGLPAKGPKRSM